MQDHEEELNVVDKQVNADSAAVETTPEPEPDVENPLGKMPNLSPRDRLLMSIDILSQGAWISMGFISNPGSGQIEKDLDKAKVAIDCVAFLAQKVESELDDSTQRELKSLVSNLQVNFVQLKSAS